MMPPKRFVLVGTGMRARDFVRPLVTRYRDSARLVGLCDLSPTRLAFFNHCLTHEWGSTAVSTAAPADFDRLLRDQHADAVIVTTVDAAHHDYITRALRAGCEVITEKPLTTDAGKCQLILDEVARTGGRVRVAFNYRWHPHRTEVRRLLAAGTIGAIKSVNLEYLLDTDHGADYFRRWHARMDQSGGLLVHKSTHHFDLVNWWLDAIPERVFAQGQLVFYGRANALARGDGALAAYPRYTDADCATDPFRFSLRDAGVMEALYLNAEADSAYVRDQNVFREDIDIHDQMSVLVRYRTGQLLNYSLVGFSPREGMRVTFNGDRGRLEYYEFIRAPVLGRLHPASVQANDQPDHRIRVFPHFATEYEVTVAPHAGGHGGADPQLAEQIFSPQPPADSHRRNAGPEQGAASALVGIAANASIRSGEAINLLDLVRLAPHARRLSELA
ncbi:MAG: Gfo/Idh/MocA family oxidoreductase [Undibacterium sp.]|nr:Gfo/Idh/MocA family oxidoreductase [Opitutaceae bacterium]